MAKKRNSNWDKIRQQSNSDKIQFRDVFEDQQLDRSHIGEKQSFTSRLVGAIFLTICIMALAYAVGVVVSFGHATFNMMTSGGNPLTSDISISNYVAPTIGRFMFVGMVGLISFAGLVQVFKKNLAAQNLMHDTSDINQYHSDQHIMLPEEMQRLFDFAPDVGAHFPAEVSSMISHMMISNKGIKKIKFARRYKEDVLDENGDVEYYKGEVMTDDDGNTIFDDVPLFDKDFAEALFDASGMPKDGNIRKYYNPSQIEYNIGNENRDKVKDCDYLSDLINNKWTFPEYEPQRPGGVYVVDTAPVNTMVVRNVSL